MILSLCKHFDHSFAIPVTFFIHLRNTINIIFSIP